MSGMITTGDTGISGYGSRTVTIEVTGVCHQEVMKTSNYTVKIPFSRMSQTIQNINLMGGKVANISLGSIVPEGTVHKSKVTNSVPKEETSRSSGKKKSRNRK